MRRGGSSEKDIDEFKDALNNRDNDLYGDMLTIIILTFASTYILGVVIQSILDYYFFTVTKRWAYIAKENRAQYNSYGNQYTGS